MAPSLAVRGCRLRSAPRLGLCSPPAAFPAAAVASRLFPAEDRGRSRHVPRPFAFLGVIADLAGCYLQVSPDTSSPSTPRVFIQLLTSAFRFLPFRAWKRKAETSSRVCRRCAIPDLLHMCLSRSRWSPSSAPLRAFCTSAAVELRYHRSEPPVLCSAPLPPAAHKLRCRRCPHAALPAPLPSRLLPGRPPWSSRALMVR